VACIEFGVLEPVLGRPHELDTELEPFGWAQVAGNDWWCCWKCLVPAGGDPSDIGMQQSWLLALAPFSWA
jgi:hypothetical protein